MLLRASTVGWGRPVPNVRSAGPQRGEPQRPTQGGTRRSDRDHRSAELRCFGNWAPMFRKSCQR